jgi:DNA repair exonuclease SbcCD ATPase subunit
MYSPVRNVVGIFSPLFVLAVGYLALGEGREAAALLEAFWSQPLLSKAAWAIVVLVPIVLVPAALWLGATLVRQRQAAQALELRLGGVRESVKALAKPQTDAEAAVHHLVRTDPEDAIVTMQQRLTEAERFVQIQQSRSEAGNLAARVEQLRAQQQALQERLAPVLEKRRSIEQLFMELGTRQSDIERGLAEVAGADDAVVIDAGLKNMTDFVRRSHQRCDDIEPALKVISGLKEDCAELQARLAPFAAVEDGVVGRVEELSAMRDRLNEEIGALERTPQGPLVERVQMFADERRQLDDRLSQLNAQFAKLGRLRTDVTSLFANFDRALDVLSVASEAEGGGAIGFTAARDALPAAAGQAGAQDVDARVAVLAAFIEATQSHLDEIERKAVAFAQMKIKLGDLQSRLLPLEAADGGVANLIEELKDIRHRLLARISQIEEDDDGSLATRVQRFTETKRELERRVSSLTEQFSKLAAIRKHIAGLFEKLSSAVSASSN